MTITDKRFCNSRKGLVITAVLIPWKERRTHFFCISTLRLIGDEVLANGTGSSIPVKRHGAVGNIPNPQFSRRWHGHCTWVKSSVSLSKMTKMNLCWNIEMIGWLRTCDSLLGQWFAGWFSVEGKQGKRVGRVGEQLYQLDVGCVAAHSDLEADQTKQTTQVERGSRWGGLLGGWEMWWGEILRLEHICSIWVCPSGVDTSWRNDDDVPLAEWAHGSATPLRLTMFLCICSCCLAAEWRGKHWCLCKKLFQCVTSALGQNCWQQVTLCF